MEENIPWLQIPMHDILRRQNLERIDNLRQIPQHSWFRNHPHLLDLLLQSPFVAELVEEVEVVGGFEDLDEPDYVGAADFAQDLDLVKSALLEFPVLFEFVDVDDFDGYGSVGVGVDASVDLAVLAFADLLVDCVVLDDLDHMKLTNFYY